MAFMKLIGSLVGALLFLLSAICVATEEVPAAPVPATSVKVPKVFELTIYPNSKAVYPPEVADTGAQGSVVVSITLTEESLISTATVKTSSGDPLLDELALKLLLRPIKLNFKGAEEYSRTEIKVTFARDDLENIWKKTCKEASVDAAYFKKMNPDKAESDLRFWNVFSGMMFLTYASQMDTKADHSKLMDDTRAACVENPDANIFLTYAKIAKLDLRKRK